MGLVGQFGWRLEEAVAQVAGRDPPDRDPLPWYLAPLPGWLENITLRLAWPVALINLLGTGFGVWFYYQVQLPTVPWFLWLLVAASPIATLFMGLSLASWRLGRHPEWLHMLAFFGNVQFGLWTPFVQLALQSPSGIATWLYWFLVGSHLLMFAQALLIHRYASFTITGIGVAAGWYLLNLLSGYVRPVAGTYTHTRLRAESINGTIDHTLPAHDAAAGAAVSAFLLCLVLAFGIRRVKARRAV